MAQNQNFPIDILAQHPSDAKAMRLKDVKKGVEFAIFNPDDDTIQVVIPATKYQTIPVTRRLKKSSIKLFITDIRGNLIDLRECGIHHYEDGTWASSFSVLADYASIRRLYTKLNRENYPEAISQLESLYTSAINGLDQNFWDNIQSYLTKQK